MGSGGEGLASIIGLILFPAIQRVSHINPVSGGEGLRGTNLINVNVTS